MASAPDEVRVVQGRVTSFEVGVTAEGGIDCRVTPSDPAKAVFDGIHSLVGTEPSGASPAAPFEFWAGGLVLLPPLGCNVTWAGAPDPMRLAVTLAASSSTPPGRYLLRLGAEVSNPGSAFFASLADDAPEDLTVVVDPPPPAPPLPALPPPELPPPLEDRSINLLPVRGVVRVRYPGSRVAVRLTQAIQVPPATGIDADDGYVTLLSDRTGNGDAQSTTLWNGSFRVDYTRLLHPEDGRRGGRASQPFTELTLLGRPLPAAAGPARAAAKKGGGLWARGRGRFRTRGRFGAGTVRGTWWRTRLTRAGDLFTVRRGVVSVSDPTLGRAVRVGRGQSYLVQPPDPRRGASRG